MNPQPIKGFREVEHTADWALNIWAPDLPSLFEQAAEGMYTLSGTRLKPGPHQTRILQLHAQDYESLLVVFLSELLYFGETERLGFDQFDIQIEGDGLHAHLTGAPLESQSKEIKAVTFHNLSIREGPHGFEVSIVFDV